MSEYQFDMWTVYDHPTDYPNGFIARRFTLDGPTSNTVTGATLEAVRAAIPQGLVCLPRAGSDDKVIVETWL